MKIGVSMFVTDYGITPGELAQASEERGFESLWMPEHTHIPTSRKSPWGQAGPTCQTCTSRRSIRSWR
jgi:alkanesulfonate monooxygenase SsuD/methylene tetrahydromethanopterin reductase-like flavin-dependent oxidoreductase (luciferase family)